MRKKAQHGASEAFKPPKIRKPSVILPAACVALFSILAVWIGVAAMTSDILWFLPIFRAEATVIDLYWDGQHIRLLPDTPEYDLVQEAVFAEFSRVRNYVTGVALSDATLENLRRNGRLLELHYATPVRIHTWTGFGASPVYYVPLSGFNADAKRVFNAGRGGPIQLLGNEKILSAAQEVAAKQ